MLPSEAEWRRQVTTGFINAARLFVLRPANLRLCEGINLNYPVRNLVIVEERYDLKIVVGGALSADSARGRSRRKRQPPRTLLQKGQTAYW